MSYSDRWDMRLMRDSWIRRDSSRLVQAMSISPGFLIFPLSRVYNLVVSDVCSSPGCMLDLFRYVAEKLGRNGLQARSGCSLSTRDGLSLPIAYHLQYALLLDSKSDPLMRFLSCALRVCCRLRLGQYFTRSALYAWILISNDTARTPQATSFTILFLSQILSSLAMRVARGVSFCWKQLGRM